MLFKTKKRFFKVPATNKFCFELNFKFWMKNLGFFVTFYMNLHTRSRSQAQKLGLRLHQKVAAPPAPAPQHWSQDFDPRFSVNQAHHVTQTSLDLQNH
jgi:hypothetical protein